MKTKLVVPIVVSVALCIGIILGNMFAAREEAFRPTVKEAPFMPKSGNKITDLMNLIGTVYVDSVRTDSIEEAIIPIIIKQLDPHSAYIPAADLQEVNDQLEGSFSGIGVQFSLQEDTIYIVDVISGGPSERAGILPGDRIVEVNDTAFVGKTLTNEKIIKKLRGPKGSQVRIGIARRGTKEVLHYDITRGDIPVRSVDVAYMITPTTGYILVNKFGTSTYQEFLTGMAKLQHAGARSVIVDLRSNSGGYLQAAENMINEFLPENDLIVYVEGRAYPREETRANGRGSFQNMKVAVLIDEFSASASEIFTGAIQDNDRGVIVGRRSFGKGLVQNQMDFTDGSAVRLTIARYYTPSGRCIQKPYERGKVDDYETDLLNRYLHGEFFSKDSISQTDTVAYFTKKGRKVYGGGGIMPDVFVPRDTTGTSPYFTALINGAYIYSFALNFADKHRSTLQTFSHWRDMSNWLDQQDLAGQIEQFAQTKGVKASEKDKKTSNAYIVRNAKSYIIRNILGDESFYPYINTFDKEVARAIDELKK